MNDKCSICPRECHVNRNEGQIGACGVDNKIYVARVALHMWEEPCISGKNGSGAVFFVGCPLGCVYCQNYEISRGRLANEVTHGKEMGVEELARAFLELQAQGAVNINLVTPTHYTYQIIEAVKLAAKMGLNLPIVYNCSGYEKVETLKLLEGIVDIYLTDLKYLDVDMAKSLSRASNYPEVAKSALAEMVRQQPKCEFDDSDHSIMRRGVIVRNLLIPGHVRNSREVVKHVYDTYGNSVYVSIMNQYTPLSQVEDMSPLNRKVTKREYNRLIDFVINLGMENVFVQEGDASGHDFIPDFE